MAQLGSDGARYAGFVPGRFEEYLYLSLSLSIYIYIYTIYACIHMYIYIYIYIYIHIGVPGGHGAGGLLGGPRDAAGGRGLVWRQDP